jgi:putative oxidoreductase
MSIQATVAERIVYGRPVDPSVEEPMVRVVPRPGTALVGRLLMAPIFLISGTMKLLHTNETVGYMAAQGIPRPMFFAIVAGLAEIAGALAIAAGFLTRIAAIGLVLFLIPTTLIFHNFWAFEGAEQKTQLVNFLKNLTIMGGLSMLIAYGAGRFSVDAHMRRPMQP